MILLTGGSGLLGRELQKHIECYAPSRKELDITHDFDYKFRYYPSFNGCGIPELIVHSGAFTDLIRAEKEKELCYLTNVIGTRNMASLGIPMIYISTEYIFDGEKGNYEEEDTPNPLNYYALTKLLGEYESRKAPRSVVIRCLFKPRPFNHDAVCDDQITTGDYVERIAPQIASAIKNFDILPDTIHIGTGRKSLKAIAEETRSGIDTISVLDVKGVRLPKDTSLNCSKWERIQRDDRFRKS